MSTELNLQAERTAFEAWAKTQGHDVVSRLETGGKFYVSSFTRHAWTIWQAARRTVTAPIGAEALPPLDKIADEIECYAESYDTMGRISEDGKVQCASVATDLRQNIIPQVQAAIAPHVERIRVLERELAELRERPQAMSNADAAEWARASGLKAPPEWLRELAERKRVAGSIDTPALAGAGIAQDVADVFRGCGFEVRDYLGAQNQFTVCGSLDSAAILLETVMTSQKVGGVERFHWTRDCMVLDPNGFYVHYREGDDIDGRTAGTAPDTARLDWVIANTNANITFTSTGWTVWDIVTGRTFAAKHKTARGAIDEALATAPSSLSGTEVAK